MTTCSRCGDSYNWCVVVHKAGEDPCYKCLLCVADEIIEAEAEHTKRTGRPPRLDTTEAAVA